MGPKETLVNSLRDQNEKMFSIYAELTIWCNKHWHQPSQLVNNEVVQPGTSKLK